ncbi:MAG: hypothetical protein GY826_30005, partial [Fuerstiella sp.]|nr:hypothetical protein [Fuerstiella sp.]
MLPLLARGQSWVRGLMCLVLLTCPAFPLFANPPVPQLQRVFPGGCQVGQSLLVTVSGSSLEGLSAVRCSHPGVVFQHREKDQFEVTVAPGTPTGMYDVQAITNHGISSTRSFYVTGRPLVVEKQAPEGESTEVVQV